MDVLHVIKAGHDAIKAELGQLESADGVKSRRQAFESFSKAVQVHMVLEKDFLYPEISGLFPGSDALVDIALAQSIALAKKLKALSKITLGPGSEQSGYAKRVAEIKEAVLAHLGSEEAQLLPRMRDLIPTQDREDLGDVFQDALNEIRRNHAGPLAPTAAPVTAVSRKRA
jgi:hemerythrin superfamily protein